MDIQTRQKDKPTKRRTKSQKERKMDRQAEKQNSYIQRNKERKVRRKSSA